MTATRNHAVPNDIVSGAAAEFLRSFKFPAHLLVAISGGSDSTGVLLAFQSALCSGDFPGFTLSACTVDHGLRAASAEEAESVGQLCARLGIPHRTRCWEGEKPSSGLQAAARMARYRLLADTAHSIGADCVVTGHTLDDQRETVAMRIARNDGAAAPGLSGMAAAMLFERGCWVLRPFLDLPRAAIRAFVAERGEGFIDDPSNLDPAFERVRVRNRLAGQEGSPGNESSGARSRSSERCGSLLQTHVRIYGGLAAFVEPVFAEGVRDPDHARALFTLAATLGGRPYLPGSRTAARLCDFLESGTDGRMTAGRVVFDRRRGGLYLYREARGLPSMSLSRGQSACWDGRFRVVNSGASPVELAIPSDTRPVVAALVAGGLAEAVAKRAARASLRIARDGETLPCPAGDVPVEHCIAPYDAFLPGFDLSLADAIADLLGRGRYLPCPVHIV